MNRVKLKKKKNKSTSTVSIIIILVITVTILLLNHFSNKAYPMIMKVAEEEGKKMAVLTIKNSVNDEILNILNESELFSVIQDNSGQIQEVNYNSVIINKVLSKTTSVVSNNLKKIEKGEVNDLSFIDKQEYDINDLKNGVIANIPVGVVTNNILLNNIGPRIPVKINLVGNVVSSIDTDISNYGLNSALVKINAKVEVTEAIILPFKTKKIKIVNNVPLSIKIIQGKVPDYYSNGKLNSVTVPIESN